MENNVRPTFVVPDNNKFLIKVLNNLFEIEKKISLHGDQGNISRNISRIKDEIKSAGFFYEDPTGESFGETRTDLEANIAGDDTENLVVTDVIKPIIRQGKSARSVVVQKGSVVAQSNTVGITNE